MARCRIDYVELATSDTRVSGAFLEQAFGWRLIDYGPAYLAFDKATSGLDGGLYSEPAPQPASLVILKTDDLEGALADVKAAGAEITRPVFDFPGGRRFHFREPGGAEMAVWAEPEK